ncbi:MAG: class I SAM-dependent methyltransferase [bacterium]|nr:class I SAM-dependent methyltransferase [bacterium]
MIDQIKKWNQSHTEIPKDKSVSQYAIEREKDFTRNSFVCELGGGTGADAIYFLQHEHKVALVDISDYALKIALEKAEQLSLKLETHRVTLGKDAIPLEDESIDVVYSRLALHYFDWQTTVNIFKEIYRIMKNGGRAYITVKSPDDYEEMSFLRQTAVEKDKGIFMDKGDIKSRFTIEQLEAILREAEIRSFEVKSYSENFGTRVDKVKSGNTQTILNEIQISKV